MVGSLILVLFLAVLGIWKSIPVGFLLDVHPALVCVMTILGGSLGVLTIFFVGTNIKTYLQKVIKPGKMAKKERRLSGFLEKYGIPGIGLLSTLIMGPGLTMALGITLVKSHTRLLLWVITGVVVWSILLTFIGQVGMNIL